ncbi:HupE/UreJ family protein [Salinarimonas rosea]|uniref:HupE/UreJ family protein n=1 Tax=Salinarimonas rosea TaxID=552063 RepID=UPI0003FAF672|nr:HupE/UreJ family protein [Salinarimonas rosea]
MTGRSTFETRILLIAAGLLAATPALAHHPMGGTTPSTFTEGLLSGFGHPIIGVDHLAALLAVGLISARFGRAFTLPGAWLLAMVAGVGLHVAAVDLPLGEVLVALSVVGLGVVAALRPTLPLAAAASLFALAGLIHGHALAEMIIGAETTPLAAYLAGLVAVQGAIMVGVSLVAQPLWAGVTLAAPTQLRMAGVAVAVVGAGFLVTGLA